MTDRALYNMNAALLADEIRSKLRFMKKDRVRFHGRKAVCCAPDKFTAQSIPFRFLYPGNGGRQ